VSNFIQTSSDLAPILRQALEPAREGDALHMCEMTSTENPQTEASRHAAAIERWEDEGGTSKVVLKHDGRKTIKNDHPSRRLGTSRRKMPMRGSRILSLVGGRVEF
jgi:hypothetical protein